MSNATGKFVLPSKYNKSDTNNVWVEFGKLAAEYNPVNLGQGYPDFEPPTCIRNALTEVGNSNNNKIHQYPRCLGHERLVESLSKLYSPLFGREINCYSELMITSGAFEALNISILGTIDVGDEVIIIEPFFDWFETLVRHAGGIPKFATLIQTKNCDQNIESASDWVLNWDDFEKLFNQKTKAIILNTPHNPLGKVFTEDELKRIANLCIKWNVLCIADEVYDWLVFDTETHHRIASYDGMWERTITLGSAGKTFGVTGWKVGWIFGPEYLLRNLLIVNNYSLEGADSIIQEALAITIENELSIIGTEKSYFTTMPKVLKEKRDKLLQILRNFGMNPIVPHGGYYIVADWTSLESIIDLSSENDEHKDCKFTKWMTKNIGVQGIPISPFFSNDNKQAAEKFVRFCFVKGDENLEKANELFAKWKKQVGQS